MSISTAIWDFGSVTGSVDSVCSGGDSSGMSSEGCSSYDESLYKFEGVT